VFVIDGTIRIVDYGPATRAVRSGVPLEKLPGARKIIGFFGDTTEHRKKSGRKPAITSYDFDGFREALTTAGRLRESVRSRRVATPSSLPS